MIVLNICRSESEQQATTISRHQLSSVLTMMLFFSSSEIVLLEDDASSESFHMSKEVIHGWKSQIESACFDAST
jgi:hypothetical protein